MSKSLLGVQKFFADSILISLGKFSPPDHFPPLSEAKPQAGTTRSNFKRTCEPPLASKTLRHEAKRRRRCDAYGMRWTSLFICLFFFFSLLTSNVVARSRASSKGHLRTQIVFTRFVCLSFVFFFYNISFYGRARSGTPPPGNSHSS